MVGFGNFDDGRVVDDSGSDDVASLELGGAGSGTGGVDSGAGSGAGAGGGEDAGA